MIKSSFFDFSVFFYFSYPTLRKNITHFRHTDNTHPTFSIYNCKIYSDTFILYFHKTIHPQSIIFTKIVNIIFVWSNDDAINKKLYFLLRAFVHFEKVQKYTTNPQTFLTKIKNSHWWQYYLTELIQFLESSILVYCYARRRNKSEHMYKWMFAKYMLFISKNYIHGVKYTIFYAFKNNDIYNNKKNWIK